MGAKNKVGMDEEPLNSEEENNKLMEKLAYFRKNRMQLMFDSESK